MTTGSGPLLGPDLATSTVALVAQPTTEPDPGGRGEDFGKSSPVGLLVVLLFLVAVAFLVRSMNKHLRRVPASFDSAPPAETAGETDRAEGKPETTDDGEPKSSSEGDGLTR